MASPCERGLEYSGITVGDHGEVEFIVSLAIPSSYRQREGEPFLLHLPQGFLVSQRRFAILQGWQALTARRRASGRTFGRPMIYCVGNGDARWEKVEDRGKVDRARKSVVLPVGLSFSTKEWRLGCLRRVIITATKATRLAC